MKLSDAGEARVRGYLFVLGRSLKGSLPRGLAADAVAEIESHLRERVADAAAQPNEAAAIERILGELGAPLHVARAYSAEIHAEEALHTGRLRSIGRALWHIARATNVGLLAAVGLFTGYAAGAAFILLAVLKPIFPGNVGIFVVDGVPRSMGALFPAPPGEVRGGYWIVPICLVLGLLCLALTQRATRRFLAWWRAQSAPWRDGR